MSSSNNSSGGIGFVGMLTILFVGLKLADIIDWSWFWVLSPVIFVIGFVFVIMVLVGFRLLNKNR